MGYQIIKKIDFSETQKKPISILKGAILENSNGEQFIQLKLRNTGNDILSKASVKIICYKQDHTVLGSQLYTYNKIFVRSGETFGTNVPIPLQFNGTDTFTIEFSNEYEKLQVNTNKIKNAKINIPIILCNTITCILFLSGIILSILLLSGVFGITGQLSYIVLTSILVIKRNSVFIWYQIFYVKLVSFFRNI